MQWLRGRGLEVKQGKGAVPGSSNSHGLGLVTESRKAWGPWAEDSYLGAEQAYGYNLPQTSSVKVLQEPEKVKGQSWAAQVGAANRESHYYIV